MADEVSATIGFHLILLCISVQGALFLHLFCRLFFSLAVYNGLSVFFIYFPA